MSKNILIIFLILIVCFLQIFLMPLFEIYSSVINLLLIGVIFLILLDFEKESFLLAGIGGIFYDFFSPAFFGLTIFYLVLIVFLLKYMTKKIFPEINIIIIGITIFIASIIFSLIFNLALKEQISLSLLLINGLYNSLFGMTIFLIFNLQQRKTKLIKF